MPLSTAETPAIKENTRTLGVATVALALAAAYVFLRSAWLSDDAFISLRQVEMFVTGEGMVWNLGERVQAFTHPAWFMLLSLGRALSGSLYYMTIALSALCISGTMWLYWRACRCTGHWSVVTVLLMALPVLSIPFRDYMTSGLENPLSFLLVSAVFALLPGIGARRTRRMLWIVLALAVLNRQDLALQFGPLALWLLFRKNPVAEIAVAAPGFALLVVWFAFATFYFGAPLPNTYFAKLSAGVPQVSLYGLGLNYYLSNLAEYPFTCAVILLGALAGLVSGPMSRLIALGVLLHLFYLFRIGGDFMLGRFLSIDFLIACFLLAQLLPVAHKACAVMLGLMAAFALVLEPSWLVRTKLESTTLKFVADERQFYYHSYGLLSPNRQWPVRNTSDDASRDIAHVAITCGFIGASRINWPDSILLVDGCGLTSPFLSRLPVAARDAPKLRTGHFSRTVPANFGNVILGTEAYLSDTASRQLWDDVQLVARAPLFDRKRLPAVWRLATGQHEFSLDAWVHPESAGFAVVSESRWLTPKPDYEIRIFPSEAHKLLLEEIIPGLEGL